MAHVLDSRAHRRVLLDRRQGTEPIVLPGGGSASQFPPSGSNANPQQSNPQQSSSSSSSSSTALSSSPAQQSSTSPASSAVPTSSSTSSSTTSSSTTSSSTTSSTTSSAAPTSTSTSSTIAVAASTPAVAKGVAQSTAIVFQSATASLAGSAASASKSSTPSSGGTSQGLIIGASAAGAVAVLGIIFGIWFFMRKRRSDEDDVLGNWNADDARRQSYMIDDPHEPTPPSVGMGMFGGAGARPPTMIERHVNNASPMLARQRSMGVHPYGAPPMPAFDHDGFPIGPGGYNNHAGPGPMDNGGYPHENGYPIASGYGAPMPHYGGPADEYAMYNTGPMPPAPPGNPFSAPYEHPMPSPVSSQVPDYASHVAEPQAALTRGPSQLQHQQHLQRQGSLGHPNAHDDSYAEVSRASVTPFQAQQYAEIREKLDSPALGAVAEEGHVPQYQNFPPHQQQNMDEKQQHGMPSPPPAAAVARASPPPSAQAKRPDTVYSAIYDEEDAYGGI